MRQASNTVLYRYGFRIWSFASLIINMNSSICRCQHNIEIIKSWHAWSCIPTNQTNLNWWILVRLYTGINEPILLTSSQSTIMHLLWLNIDNLSHYDIQYIPRNMHTVFALLCFVVVIHWLIFPYPSGLLHWHCGNLTIAPVPAKQPWWIWINTSCEFIMNDCITTTKQSTTKPCAYLLGYTVACHSKLGHPML